jgi:hypothetical protein
MQHSINCNRAAVRKVVPVVWQVYSWRPVIHIVERSPAARNRIGRALAPFSRSLAPARHRQTSRFTLAFNN